MCWSEKYLFWRALIVMGEQYECENIPYFRNCQLQSDPSYSGTFQKIILLWKGIAWDESELQQRGLIQS